MLDNKFEVNVNAGELSRPGTVLVEKIANAIGGIFKPHQIKQIAKAEAEAQIIKTQAQVEIADIKQRAITRFVAEEAIKQKNIECIVKQAIPKLEDSSSPENIDNDWITNFLDKCRIISDKEMQSLWAKILASEANSPGKYSKRTVNFLGEFDKSDAKLFTSLCRFVWSINGNITPLIYDPHESIYQNEGITYDTLTHLDSIGLIVLDIVELFRIDRIPKRTTIFYYGSPLNLKYFKEKGNYLNTGIVCLTEVGKQLFTICNAEPLNGFYEYAVRVLRKNNSFFSYLDRQKLPVFFSIPTRK